MPTPHYSCQLPHICSYIRSLLFSHKVDIQRHCLQLWNTEYLPSLPSFKVMLKWDWNTADTSFHLVPIIWDGKPINKVDSSLSWSSGVSCYPVQPEVHPWRGVLMQLWLMTRGSGISCHIAYACPPVIQKLSPMHLLFHVSHWMMDLVLAQILLNANEWGLCTEKVTYFR